ncbi:RES family NAD+ phosphorylase [Paraconexibacter antarcticus]|uniref:RES family NAD+ phosphorylase n=1 Tax=Paraconexibacter antarcticus TaxID=2949664 RepID=A0ABY5DMU4_9ACTN|nr:RES family NAD+ phosphorylase [Paraconexibacter antarcticus]UTI63320.1 RES family NAD+ phosphorylase [Paraconexibacter antarcticus]
MTPARRTVRPTGALGLAGPPTLPTRYPRGVVRTVAAGTELRRIYVPPPAGYTPSATAFRTDGPRARFDHHRRPGPFPQAAEDPSRGIFYAAEAFGCCVAEFWGDDWLITPGPARLAVLRADRELQLLSLMGSDATAVGTLAAVTMDGDRHVTQDWGRHWYEHPQFQALHGIRFPSSHTSQPACAFWERAAGAFTVLFDEPVLSPAVLPDLLVTASALGITVLGTLPS